MKIVLGKKQNLTVEGERQWWNVIEHIEDYVSREECDEWTEDAKRWIREQVGNKTVGYAWSGGKDSLVLSDICQSMGITRSWCFITDLEYPVWEKWLRDNLPPDCSVVDVKFGLDFLVEHPKLLFAQGRDRQEWNRLALRSNFSAVTQANDLGVLCVGHRVIDGNFCGREGVIRKKNGEIRIAPLFKWPHEMLFAYMHYHGIEFPPIYKWHRGFWQGTLWWPHRYVDSVEQGWEEVYAIDSSIVHNAATKIESARVFLEKIGGVR